jgi:putative salt-induced outer membrane protein YdiY
MRLSITIFAALILFATVASADIVVLENGDQVSGQILRTEGKLLVVKNPHIGIVRLPLAAVTNIETGQTYTVVLESGDRVSGEIQGEGGNLNVTNAEGTVSTPIAGLIGLYPAPRDLAYPDEPPAEPAAVDEAIEQTVSFWDGWVHTAELGLNWQTGNTERLGFVFGWNSDRETEKSKTALRIGIIYTEDDEVRSANNQFLTIQHDIKWGQWYFFGLGGLTRDEFKEIDLRAFITPGIGYIVNDDDEWKLRLEVGPTATWTDWENRDSEWTFDIYAALKAEVQVFDSARLAQNLWWFPSITNSPDGRLISETFLEQPLSEQLFLKISFLVTYDTTVQAPTKETDTNLLVTLAIKF